MARTLMQRMVDALPFLDKIGDAVQPEVQKAVDAGGVPVRNALDGVWLEAPLHPVMTDVPVGSWTAALVFDGLDIVADNKAMRHAADASVAFGTVGALGAAVTGLSDWRYLSGGSKRMGVAHGILNTVGLVFSVVSLVQRLTGRRNAGRLTFPDRILHQRHGRPPRGRTVLPLRATCGQKRLRGGRSRRFHSRPGRG